MAEERDSWHMEHHMQTAALEEVEVMLVMEGVTVETEDSLYPMEEAVVPGVLP